MADRKALLTQKSETERGLRFMEGRLKEIEQKGQEYQRTFMQEKVGLVRRISEYRNKIITLDERILNTWP